MPKRCVIIGAGGQLGRALCQEFISTHEVIETFHQPHSPHQPRVDLADAQSLTAFLEEWRPDWILIAGAFCNVDLCETQQETCLRVNVEGPRTVAEFASRHGASVVYFSTDHVFDGSQTDYVESDPVRPLNIYAKSKVQGERALQTLLPDLHLILRTAWLYGPDRSRRNFILRLIDQLRAGERIRVPQDQWGSPTYTKDLAQTTRFLLETGKHGLFHATGPELLNRISLAQHVCAQFQLDERNLVPTPTDRLDQTAQRPLRVQLSCRRLAAMSPPSFRGIREGLVALQEQQTALQGS